MEPPDMWVPGVLIPLSVLSSTSMVVSYGILYRWIIHISTYSGMYSSMDATYYDMYAEGKYPLGDAIY